MHYWRSLRPQQWIKNAFVWAGFLFAREWRDPTLTAHVAAAFIAFCLLASAVYVGNDWLDRASDRTHPVKRHHPPVPSAQLAARELTDHRRERAHPLAVERPLQQPAFSEMLVPVEQA